MCVCVCVCVCYYTYVYICTHINICILYYIYLYICIYTYIMDSYYIYIYIYIYIYNNIYICVFIYIFVSTNISVREIGLTYKIMTNSVVMVIRSWYLISLLQVSDSINSLQHKHTYSGTHRQTDNYTYKILATFFFSHKT